MAGLNKIKARIKEIAEGSHANVSLGDIEQIVDQLGRNGFKTSARNAGDHQRLFVIDHVRFGICNHRKGGKQLDPVYVKGFIKKMIELDLYEHD